MAELQKVSHNGEQPGRYELVAPASGGGKPAPIVLVPVLIPSPVRPARTRDPSFSPSHTLTSTAHYIEPVPKERFSA